ncbi:MAG: gamma-glutamyltransferase [Proteobacteria bacterium]|nr:gamma-glutamyltransferase [Pseudomonadota bacterium]MBI3497500.1 gamma-glutamyltransferase [Pseudomonadota bacterium]
MAGKRPTISSIKGMVASAHPHASMAGVRLLRSGGNAFDAIAAVAAALNVVEPYMSGLAGMGMATCYVAKERRVRTLDFITRVPEKFNAKGLKRSDVARGPMAIATPGNLAGWCELVRAHGSKPLAEIFQPAIELARDGFPVTENNAGYIAQADAELKSYKAFYGDWLKTYTDGKGGMPAGNILKQPDLARTYEAIAAEGPSYLHGGKLGREIVRHVQKLGGVLTDTDFANAEPVWLEPLVAPYRGLKVHTLPPPSEGFQFLMTLQILDGFDLGTLEQNGVEHIDTVMRAIRLAGIERINNNNPPVAKLAELMGNGSIERLRARVRDGMPIAGPAEQFPEAEPALAGVDREHTTSFSVADREGNVVCITQSLGAGFGCGVVLPGSGVALNNFLYWGELNPKGTNYMRGGGALALPMAPSVSTRDGKPVLALGTPGSYGICQTQVQALVQHVDFKQPLQDAIDAPRLRLMDGREAWCEARVPEKVRSELIKRGHDIKTLEDYTMKVGGMHGVAIDQATGAMTGGADPRRDGYALGV